MRNALVALTLAATAVVAQANPHHRHDTAVALGIGVIVGAIVANQHREVVYTPAPVYTPPVVHVPVYSHPLPPMYRAMDVYFPECGCVRTVTVRVQ